MIKFLIRIFIKNHENVNEPDVRKAYGVFAGIFGIVCNLALVIVKLSAGIFMNSIAIISDGLNNLSDMGSSAVSLIGAKLSSKKPDREHPFGHGRFEYIAALVVSFIIIFMGLETLMSSFGKIISPEPVRFSAVSVLLLGLSCLVKLWMAGCNRFLGRKINSSVLLATAKDCFNDCFASLAVIASTIVGKALPAFPADGVFGLFVSVLILKAGFDVARETVSMLLGGSPDPELVKKIYGIIMSEKDIIGVHDLLVHDYGPGRIVASVHAEVPDNADICHVHEIIDFLEKKISEALGVLMVIHMDPIAVNCPKTAAYREMTERFVHEISEEYSVHDFRITDGEENINLIFDLVLPVSLSEKEIKSVLQTLTHRIKQHDSRFSTVINIDTE